MSGFGTALSTEWSKFWRARVVQLATAALVLAIPLMDFAFITAGDKYTAKLGPAFAEGGWVALFAGSSQITATAGVIGGGVLLAWFVGREFVQGTIVGLFALPIARSTIMLAKLALYLIWVVTVSVGLPLVVLAIGALLGFGAVDPALALKQFAVMLLSGLIAVPAAWIATLTRGYIGAIGAMGALVVVATIGAVSGIGGWLPPAAPGLWAASPLSNPDLTTLLQLALVIPFAFAFGALALRSWHRLQTS